MRRLLVLAAASAAVIDAPFAAHAQYGQPGGAQGPGGGGRGGGDQQKQSEDDAKKKKRDKEWGDSSAPLAQMRNAGPCPFVKTLYDASRYVEFKDAREASANVGFSGEIQGISAGCQYKDDEPITVAMDVLFELGKGPQATGSSKTFHHCVALTGPNPQGIPKRNSHLP